MTEDEANSDDLKEMPHNVVNIGDYRIERTKSGYDGIAIGKDCPHRSLVMDDNGHTCTCDDCKKQVSAYWALGMLITQYRREYEKLRRMQALQRKRETKTLRLKAAQTIETAWRRRGTVPTCPHCDRGIFPSDTFGAVGKALELAEREKSPPKKWTGAATAEVVKITE
ncbi:hypothetical protein K2X14_07885 [Acetobacter sp. TBRC 12305]|uniref:Uncharacterized protein n=1 Tax=Acetobacter garciniae TaxID=2817435 RepID=A0A939HM10_9PROT|nr:hypothetical protein [Acetobacter garciniae]MBO1325275.1 hypothetical protein [Acetobacter garciniae]MBX0344753.1 hypothetical protein [Acetobacter garciniae]